MTQARGAAGSLQQHAQHGRGSAGAPCTPPQHPAAPRSIPPGLPLATTQGDDGSGLGKPPGPAKRGVSWSPSEGKGEARFPGAMGGQGAVQLYVG